MNFLSLDDKILSAEYLAPIAGQNCNKVGLIEIPALFQPPQRSKQAIA
jgi:hypothetical protein